jgi:hypothetical protein
LFLSSSKFSHSSNLVLIYKSGLKKGIKRFLPFLSIHFAFYLRSTYLYV